ncbi:hypothetical protein [Succinivibrio dextrinosolvens]|uniref:hypothetical protein n=1 Tax=Succinivibrio dextrinosolvens TaxID=83771 RepID=UPI00241E8061|nr:hypothetical protein [Succinivibrio dextrinosolvens]MBE6422862.1 hypothetical protein [Succinivibrio dextrinosolvens]
MGDESDLNKKRQELQHFLGKVKKTFWITLFLLFSFLCLVFIFHQFISSKSYSDCILHNDAEACYRYGSHAENNYDPIAREFYVKACRYGSADGCYSATGNLPMMTEIIPPNEDYMMQIKACALGKSEKCVDLITRNKEKAFSKLLDEPDLYKKVYSSVCPESQDGCTFLSDLISDNYGEVRERAISLTDECKKSSSNSKSCGVASLYYLFGSGVKQDRQTAANMIFSPCSLEKDFNYNYCKNIVHRFDYYSIDPKPFPQLHTPVSILLKGLEKECSNLTPTQFKEKCHYKLTKYQSLLCTLNNECENSLIKAYENREKVQTEFKKKAEKQYLDMLKPYIKDIPEDQIENGLAEKCNQGDGVNCGVLAGMYQNGTNVEESSEKNLEYLKKGCDLNDLSSCRILSTKYLVSNREKEALEISKKLCHELNQKDGCANIANLYLFNAKFSDKEEQGKEYLKALCDDKSELSQHYCSDFTRALEHRDSLRKQFSSSTTK